jgi:uncharacterized membrane protein
MTTLKFRSHIKKKLTMRNVSTAAASSAVDGKDNGPQPTKKKSNKKNEEKANRNITLMVITMACTFIIGNFPVVTGVILAEFINTSSVFFIFFAISANIILFTTHGCYIFIYYHYNKVYRDIFAKMFLPKKD